MKKMMLLSLILLLVMAGCSRSSNDTSPSVSAPDMAESEEEMRAEEEMAGRDPVTNVDVMGEKVIKTVNFDTTTFQFDDDREVFDSILSSYSGVIESMNESTNSGMRYFSATLRIPSDRLDAFVEELGQHFNERNLTMNSEDVSAQYVDLEARIENLRTREARLRELMEEAETTETLLLIDAELSNVTYEIERLTGERNAIDDRVDYSTVEFSMSEEREASVQDSSSFFDDLSRAFSGGFSSFLRSIQNLILWIVRSLPYLIVLAVVLAGLALLSRRRNLGKPLLKRKPKDEHTNRVEKIDKES